MTFKQAYVFSLTALGDPHTLAELSTRRGPPVGSIYLIRHGQASFGADDYDVLSPTGIRQAEILGDHLLNLRRPFRPRPQRRLAPPAAHRPRRPRTPGVLRAGHAGAGSRSGVQRIRSRRGDPRAPAGPCSMSSRKPCTSFAMRPSIGPSSSACSPPSSRAGFPATMRKMGWKAGRNSSIRSTIGLRRLLAQASGRTGSPCSPPAVPLPPCSS